MTGKGMSSEVTNRNDPTVWTCAEFWVQRSCVRLFFGWRLLGLIPGGTLFSQLNKGVKDSFVWKHSLQQKTQLWSLGMQIREKARNNQLGGCDHSVLDTFVLTEGRSAGSIQAAASKKKIREKGICQSRHVL